MRTSSLIIIIFCLAFSVSAQSVLQLRNMYYRASVNCQSADSLYEQLNNVTQNSAPILQGYKGMAALLVCSHSCNPYNKIKYFNEGKAYLDKAIEKDADNGELRYLRYSVQTNVPVFLGYRGNIGEDKTIILNKLNDTTFKKADQDLFNRMVKYLLQTSNTTAEEKIKVKNYSND